MKKLLLATTALISLNVSAITDEQYQICESTAGLVGDIMKARQANVPMVKIMAALKDDIKPVFSGFVIEAYKQPLFSTKKNKEESVNEFQNGAFIGCIEAFEEKEV